ncbi:hypothetical protein CG747_12820 [Streptomyces sp. CB02959]|nr:hypothetical protein CG747_12820 [Streptomyces sp. CB02959]
MKLAAQGMPVAKLFVRMPSDGRTRRSLPLLRGVRGQVRCQQPPEAVVEAIDEVMATSVLRRAARSPARLASSRPAPREAAAMVASMRRCSINSARWRFSLLRNDIMILAFSL